MHSSPTHCVLGGWSVRTDSITAVWRGSVHKEPGQNIRVGEGGRFSSAVPLTKGRCEEEPWFFSGTRSPSPPPTSRPKDGKSCVACYWPLLWFLYPHPQLWNELFWKEILTEGSKPKWDSCYLSGPHGQRQRSEPLLGSDLSIKSLTWLAALWDSAGRDLGIGPNSADRWEWNRNDLNICQHYITTPFG